MARLILHRLGAVIPVLLLVTVGVFTLLHLTPGDPIDATQRQVLTNVILPLSFPGVVAGSIFTFSLTLGDFIVPQLFGTSSFYIGKAVLTYQGTSGNIPLAAAFTMGPIVIMIVYLLIARRLGAFDAL